MQYILLPNGEVEEAKIIRSPIENDLQWQVQSPIREGCIIRLKDNVEFFIGIVVGVSDRREDGRFCIVLSSYSQPPTCRLVLVDDLKSVGTLELIQ